MINRLSNPINRNRSAAKISKVVSSSRHPSVIYQLMIYLMYVFRHPLKPTEELKFKILYSLSEIKDMLIVHKCKILPIMESLQSPSSLRSSELEIEQELQPRVFSGTSTKAFLAMLITTKFSSLPPLGSLLLQKSIFVVSLLLFMLINTPSDSLSENGVQMSTQVPPVVFVCQLMYLKNFSWSSRNGMMLLFNFLLRKSRLSWTVDHVGIARL